MWKSGGKANIVNSGCGEGKQLPLNTAVSKSQSPTVHALKDHYPRTDIRTKAGIRRVKKQKGKDKQRPKMTLYCLSFLSSGHSQLIL